MAWTTPRTWAAAEVVTASLMNVHVRDNLKALTEWTSYTPTWTATGGTPTVGDGTLTGKYIVAGNLCHFWFRLRVASGSSIGTTTSWAWSLPATAAGYSSAVATIVDEGNAYFAGFAPISPAATAIDIALDGTAARVGYLQPMTWSTANGDSLFVSGTYEC